MNENPRRALRNLDALPKKSLGQNFCIDKNILEKIADSAALGPADAVVEIGAGTGALTAFLAERADLVHAVEIDGRLFPALEERFGGDRRVCLHFGDGLKLLSSILTGLDEPAVVVGNLPYNISSQLAIGFLENRTRIKRAIVTLQLEMAQRLCAAPGTKDYGALSVRLQTAAAAHLLFKIKPTCFYPAPDVMSACIRMDFTKPHARQPLQEEIFVKAVKAGFSQRRKQLRNALFSSFSPEEVDLALSVSGIDPRERAENLSVEQWVVLGDAFAQKDCK